MSKIIDEKLLGHALKAELNKGYDIVKISRWAFSVYSNNIRSLTPYVKRTLLCLFSMEDDPQFEYTEAELHLLADKLINGEKNPLEQIHEMKLRETK